MYADPHCSTHGMRDEHNASILVFPVNTELGDLRGMWQHA